MSVPLAERKDHNLRIPSRYFATYAEPTRVRPGTYLRTGNIEMDLGTDALALASTVISAFDRQEVLTPQQQKDFIQVFGFTPKQARQQAHTEDLYHLPGF